MTARPFAACRARRDGASVQGALETAIEAFCGETRHACTAPAAPTPASTPLGQVAHVDLRTRLAGRDGARRAQRPPAARADRRAGRRAVAGATSTPASRPRARRYLYRILNRRAPPALDPGRVWHVQRPLDAEAMHEAAQALVGQHDFTTFRDVECQAKSPVKTLDVLDVVRDGEEVHLVIAGALVPASPGALDDRHAGRGRAWAAGPPTTCAGARRARPHGLRAGRAAGRAVSDAGGLPHRLSYYASREVPVRRDLSVLFFNVLEYWISAFADDDPHPKYR